MTNWLVLADAQPLWSSGWVDYIKLMLVLGGILIVAFLTLRYWMPKLASLNRNSSGPIQVLTRFSLEPNKTLYLVALGEARMLLASSEAGVQLIQTLASEDLEKALDNKIEPENDNSFGRLLRSMKSRNG
jgi:flagellar biogenesis protein FliO